MAKELTTRRILETFNKNDFFFYLDRERKSNILFEYSEYYCNCETKPITPSRWIRNYMGTGKKALQWIE